MTQAEERAEIDRRRESRELEIEGEPGTAHVGVLPGIDLEREELRSQRLPRLDPERLRRMPRALERHEMIADAPRREPRGMDQQGRLALEIGQQIRPRLAVGGIARRMRRFVDGIDGHGLQCNVRRAPSRMKLLLARFDRPLDLPRDLSRKERVALLGGKGDGLMRMAGELGLPVPPGFILTTRACALHREQGWTAALDEALHEGMAGLEAQMGRRFGGDADANRPALLVSVRSGAPVSMPGMLDTVLNVGLDAHTTAALAREDARLAEECRARLAESFRTSVGSEPPAEVWDQLRAAVEAVFRSANSARALAYRRREGLAGEAQTAVNVQAMVLGNRDARSATGVYFTRDPATGERRAYGDVLFQAQGEDVVSGRHATQPLAELERRLPEAASELFALGNQLERAYRDLCEIEFTIESGRLWLLQVRVGKRNPRAALRIASELALDPDFPLDRREAVERVRALLADPPVATSLRSNPASAPLARGIGASPGIASGELATTVERAVARAATGHAVLLVRPETSPEDVEGMAVAAALLTSRGGLASHAAVVARGWGIPAVVGLAALSIDAGGIELGGRRFAVGDSLSLDGASGDVYAGALEVDRRIVPEAALLLEWARELGIALESNPSAAATPIGGAVSAAGDPDALLPVPESTEASIFQVLAIKGSATREALAAALGATAESLAAPIDALVTTGALTPAKPAGFRLGDTGRARSIALLETDRQRLGPVDAHLALDSFQALDTRMKEAVTDWQLRLEGAERIPNDHMDARWDATVGERLATLCEDAVAWLKPLASKLPRLHRYADRLAIALSHFREGDARFVASPRVDSLHGVWFELHEDLIRLAGSTRAEELAAGRAG